MEKVTILLNLKLRLLPASTFSAPQAAETGREWVTLLTRMADTNYQWVTGCCYIVGTRKNMSGTQRIQWGYLLVLSCLTGPVNGTLKQPERDPQGLRSSSKDGLCDLPR